MSHFYKRYDRKNPQKLHLRGYEVSKTSFKRLWRGKEEEITVKIIQKKEKTLETGTARGALNAAFFSVLIVNVPC